MTHTPDPQWYSKIWTLDIRDMSWTECTESQIAFLVDLLGLQGHERILEKKGPQYKQYRRHKVDRNGQQEARPPIELSGLSGHRSNLLKVCRLQQPSSVPPPRHASHRPYSIGCLTLGP